MNFWELCDRHYILATVLILVLGLFGIASTFIVAYDVGMAWARRNR